MTLDLTRKIKTEKSIIGDLCVNGVFECYVLERADVACPAGTYDLELYDSPKNGKNTLQLKNVPNRRNIQIHVANFPHELLGCLAPGKSYGLDCVMSSRIALNALREKVLPKLLRQERVSITIR
jgi:hypothetical protein